MKRLGYIFCCICVLLFGLLCALVIGDDCDMIASSIKGLRNKEKKEV